MADMKVVVTSVHLIKPTVPTPSHLRRLRRSFLDQLTPQFYMHCIYFYSPPLSPPPNNSDTNSTTTTTTAALRKIDSLKQSLADILPVYYPLSGRAADPLFLDCNDAGVHFSESTVDRCLSDIVDHKIADSLNLLLPFPDMGVVDDDRILAVQANVFECGGLALGICCSHKVADALSKFTFVNDWAHLARTGVTPAALPNFDAASIFPPQDLSKLIINKGADDIANNNKPARIHEAPAARAAQKVVTKIVTFTGSAISQLRDKYTRPELRPTLVEAISAFIWTRFIKIGQDKDNPASTSRAPDSELAGRIRTYVVTQGVNLRVRADPALPEKLFGNISRFALAYPVMDEPEEIGQRLVGSMRNGIKKIDGEYVKRLQGGDMEMVGSEIGELVGSGDQDVVPFGFSSLNRMPMYDADFGWGRPVWVSSVHVDFKNVVALFPTQSGDGVEAWINMEKEDLCKLQADQDFVDLVSSSNSSKANANANKK